MFPDVLIKGVEHVHPVTVKLFIYFILVNDKNLSDIFSKGLCQMQILQK